MAPSSSAPGPARPAPGPDHPAPDPGRPLRADAARNRRALLAAARRVFERDGFVAARITDIADEAGLAHGSFYSHFRNKEDALAAVLGEVEEEMLHPGPSLAGTPGGQGGEADPVAVIHAANVAYLEAYRRNAKLMALLEQVATVDERFAALRRERSEAFLARKRPGHPAPPAGRAGRPCPRPGPGLVRAVHHGQPQRLRRLRDGPPAGRRR